MIYKKRILFYITCVTLLSGCGENFSAGVIKGGSGNGKPKEPEIGIVINKIPLNEHYNIWLSKPQIDYCQGVKRTLQFLNPLTLETVDEDQLIEVMPTDEVNNQIILQVHWENQSDQSKTIIHPSCEYLVEFEETGDDLPMRSMSCDVEKITILNQHDIYISEHEYKLDHTSNGMLKHSNSIQFLPLEGAGPDCDNLNIGYTINNK